MNPFELSHELSSKMQEYIRSTMPVEDAYPDFKEKFDAFFAEHKLVQDPYLELMRPYTPGASLQDLANDNIIDPQNNLYPIYY